MDGRSAVPPGSGLSARVDVEVASRSRVALAVVLAVLALGMQRILDGQAIERLLSSCMAFAAGFLVAQKKDA